LDELEHEFGAYSLGGEGCKYYKDYCEDVDKGKNRDYEQLVAVPNYVN